MEVMRGGEVRVDEEERGERGEIEMDARPGHVSSTMDENINKKSNPARDIILSHFNHETGCPFGPCWQCRHRGKSGQAI